MGGPPGDSRSHTVWRHLRPKFRKHALACHVDTPQQDLCVVRGCRPDSCSRCFGRWLYYVDEEQSGVLITGVEDYSNAAEQGLRPGDVIASVSMEPVASTQETAEKLLELRKADQEVAMIKVSRQGSETFFALRLADA